MSRRSSSCSPRPSRPGPSRVQQEIDHWLRSNPSQRMLIVLTAGEMQWGPGILAASARRAPPRFPSCCSGDSGTSRSIWICAGRTRRGISPQPPALPRRRCHPGGHIARLVQGRHRRRGCDDSTAARCTIAWSAAASLAVLAVAVGDRCGSGLPAAEYCAGSAEDRRRPSRRRWPVSSLRNQVQCRCSFRIDCRWRFCSPRSPFDCIRRLKATRRCAPRLRCCRGRSSRIPRL